MFEKIREVDLTQRHLLSKDHDLPSTLFSTSQICFKDFIDISVFHPCFSQNNYSGNDDLIDVTPEYPLKHFPRLQSFFHEMHPVLATLPPTEYFLQINPLFQSTKVIQRDHFKSIVEKSIFYIQKIEGIPVHK